MVFLPQDSMAGCQQQLEEVEEYHHPNGCKYYQNAQQVITNEMPFYQPISQVRSKVFDYSSCSIKFFRFCLASGLGGVSRSAVGLLPKLVIQLKSLLCADALGGFNPHFGLRTSQTFT